MGEQDSLLANRINNIELTEDGTMWLATNNKGIIALRNGEVKLHLTAKQGLASNWCSYLWSDSDTVLWVGSQNGLTKVTTTPDLELKNI